MQICCVSALDPRVYIPAYSRSVYTVIAVSYWRIFGSFICCRLEFTIPHKVESLRSISFLYGSCCCLHWRFSEQHPWTVSTVRNLSVGATEHHRTMNILNFSIWKNVTSPFFWPRCLAGGGPAVGRGVHSEPPVQGHDLEPVRGLDCTSLTSYNRLWCHCLT